MIRKLLIVTSQPLGAEVSAELEGSNWDLHIARTARDARGKLDEHDVLVGLFILWPDDDERYKRELMDVVSQATHIRWIGGLDRRQLANVSYLSLAAEHLHDFVSLPLDPPRIAVIAGHAYGMAELDRLFMAQQLGPADGEFGMLGTCAPMRALFEAIHQAAASHAPLVISGETGSGKETTARAVHAASSRAHGPFIPIHCASQLPSKLAGQDPCGDPGTFDIEQAFSQENAGGTLFLDGVEDLPAAAQARLLSMVDNESRGRGHDNKNDTSWDDAHLRLVCSSTQELELSVQNRLFRADLFYRLQVLSIRVPSLRERGEDVWTLARHFLQQFQESHPTQAVGFNKDALAMLSLYDWPGNLRELRNRVHQAALYCDGTYITPTHLDLERRGSTRRGLTLQEIREKAERQAIDAAVKRHHMNLTRAAEELAISRMTLYRMLEKHGLAVER